MEDKYKLAIFELHPVHYRIPIYKKLSKHKNIDLTVYFKSDFGLKKDYNKLFNKKISWGFDLKGINYKILEDYSLRKNTVQPKSPLNRRIFNELSKEGYDAIIVYTYATLTNKFVFLASKLTKTPIIFRDEIDFLKEPTGIKKFIRRIFFHILFRMCDSFLYSYPLNAEFYKHFGVKEEQLFFHPCAVDNGFLQKERRRLKNQKNKIKKELGIPKKNKIINFTGRIIQIKRPLDIIKAYERLPEKTKNKTSIIFIGEGNKKEEIKNYVKNKNLKNVLFLGFKKPKELPKYYSISDLFIVASEEDRSPKAMNEAMNFELPIITTDKVATARDMIIHGKNGYHYNLGDVNTLSKYMQGLLTNEKLRRKMGKEALKKVNKWSFDKDIEAIIKALEYVRR